MDLLEQNLGRHGSLDRSCFSATDFVATSTSESHAKKMKMECEANATQMDCSTDPASHEQRLSASLDSALSSMPLFTASLTKRHLAACSGGSDASLLNPSSGYERNSGGAHQGCSSCRRTFSSYFKPEPVYQLPCSHLVCRSCLAEKQKSLEILCMNCKRSVATHDVVRVHF
uniref:Uncharacterized protein n=3 Tax=Sphaerodactylus townsendi TaxID=933632 RepID=A0ACB8E963_9SAUR